MLPSPSKRGLGFRCQSVFEPPTGSLALRPGDSLTILTMALSVGFIRFVSSTNATQATRSLTFTPVGLLPLNMPAFAGRTLAHTGLADVDAQLEQFAVDARRTPKRIVAAHLANQFPCFLADRRSSRLAAAHLPGPEHPKPFAVLGNHRLRFHDHQGRPPAGPVPRQPGPEKSVRSGRLRSLHRAPQNVELMAKSEHLNLQSGPSAKAIPQCCQNGH